VWEWLGEQRSEDDDVDGGDVGPDAAVSSTSLQDLIDGPVGEVAYAVDRGVIAPGGMGGCVKDEPEAPWHQCREPRFARWGVNGSSRERGNLLGLVG
jgi:hypothetical protein